MFSTLFLLFIIRQKICREVIYVAWSVNQIPELSTEVQNLASISVTSPKDETQELDFSNIIKRLQDILQKVKTSEERAYRIFGVTDINELQSKIDHIMSSGIIKMFNFNTDEFDNMVKNLAQDKITIYDFSKPIEVTIKNPVFQNQLKENMGVTDIGIDMVETFIRTTQQVRKHDSLKIDVANTKHKRSPKRFNYLGEKGLNKYLAEVIYDPNKKDKIQLRFSDFMPKEFQDRLQKEYQLEFNSIVAGDFSREQVAAALQQWINVHITDTYIKSLLNIELSSINLSNFDVNKSAASIKGFLGEVATTVILKALCPGQNITPTGAMRKIRNGQELPIDILLKDIGFQVKNYQFIDNKVTFGHRREDDKMLMGNFITERARIEGSLKQVLYSLYGSLHYNQIIRDPNNIYTPIRNQLVSQAENATKVFEGYIDNILKISDFFGSKDNVEFAKENLYFNTFFMIRDRIIPSSAILNNLIIQLENQQKINDNNKIIKSSFNIEELGQEAPIYTGNHFGTHKVANKNLANKVSIRYVITIDMENILGGYDFINKNLKKS